MILLEKYKLILKLIGLDPFGGRWNIIVRFIHWLIMTPFYLMMGIFVIVNIRDDISKALTVMPLILIVTSLMVMFSHLVSLRCKMYSLMDELRDIVIESTNM